MKYLLTILIVPLLSVCSAQTVKNVKPDHYKTSEFDVVIFPAASPISGKYFTPSRAEVDAAEKALQQQLKDINKGSTYYRPPAVHKNLGKYKRQYSGDVGKNGHKILFINCLWERASGQWTSQKIGIVHGDSRFWNVKYDLNSGKLFDLHMYKDQNVSEEE